MMSKTYPERQKKVAEKDAKEAYFRLDSFKTGLSSAGSSLGSFVDVNAAAWCILLKVDSRFPKTKGTTVEAGVLGDKTPLNRRIVRSMSVAGRAGEKCIVDDEH